MDDLCVLFAYHKCDDLTLHHLGLLRKHNSQFPIIPITDDVPELLPDSIDVKHFPDFWPKTHPWLRCDTMLYRWFLNRAITAKRYLYLEYDCLCSSDLEELYRDVWDADVATRDFFLPGQNIDTENGENIAQEWNWFADAASAMDPADLPYAAGLVPLACTLYSHAGLSAILETVTHRDVFCELRIGTAVRKAGLQPAIFPDRLKRTVQWDRNDRDKTSPGLYHAVKEIVIPA